MTFPFYPFTFSPPFSSPEVTTCELNFNLSHIFFHTSNSYVFALTQYIALFWSLKSLYKLNSQHHFLYLFCCMYLKFIYCHCTITFYILYEYKMIYKFISAQKPFPLDFIAQYLHDFCYKS